jgi:hypothetical protein
LNQAGSLFANFAAARSVCDIVAMFMFANKNRRDVVSAR